MKTLELDLYGDVGDPAGIDPAKVVALLRNAPDVKAITVRLNSAGGNAFDGVAIMNALKDHPAKVTVKVDGLAASAAALISLAGDTVEIGDGAFMMLHRTSAAAFGNGTDLRELAATMSKVDAELVVAIAKRCRKPVETVRGWLDAETWFTGPEAVAAGLADKAVADPGATAKAAKALARAKRPIVDALHLPERLKNPLECVPAAKPKADPKAVTAKVRRNPFILSDVDEAADRPNPFAPKAGPAPGKVNPFRPKPDAEPDLSNPFLPKGEPEAEGSNPFLPEAEGQ